MGQFQWPIACSDKNTSAINYLSLSQRNEAQRSRSGNRPLGWRHGVVLNMLVAVNEVALRRAGYYLDGWLSTTKVNSACYPSE